MTTALPLISLAISLIGTAAGIVALARTTALQMPIVEFIPERIDKGSQLDPETTRVRVRIDNPHRRSAVLKALDFQNPANREVDITEVDGDLLIHDVDRALANTDHESLKEANCPKKVNIWVPPQHSREMTISLTREYDGPLNAEISWMPPIGTWIDRLAYRTCRQRHVTIGAVHPIGFGTTVD